jgi:ATP-dependent Clp protease ATP-binding subunit ClpA
MYERVTDRARKAMQLANQEAQRFNHEYIGTEHILLGLAKERRSRAANSTRRQTPGTQICRSGFAVMFSQGATME